MVIHNHSQLDIKYDWPFLGTSSNLYVYPLTDLDHITRLVQAEFCGCPWLTFSCVGLRGLWTRFQVFIWVFTLNNQSIDTGRSNETRYEWSDKQGSKG